MESTGHSLRSRIAGWLLATLVVVLVAAACRTFPATPRIVAAPATRVVKPLPFAIPSVPAPAVRVGIAVEVGRVPVGAAGGVDVCLVPEAKSAPRCYHLARATFEPGRKAGVRLVDTGDEAGLALVASPAQADRLAAFGATYRGVLEIRPAAGATLTAVNVVNLEEYVRGVVPNELSSGSLSSIEALKAQAVAVRTYALSHLRDYASKGFDLCATPACQLYRGAGSESPLGDLAVAETRGVLATWRGRPIRAYYTSACGGHTESGRDVFDDQAPYLRGVACVPEDHAAWSVESERALHEDAWQVRLTPAEVRLAVARFGSVGSIRDLVPRRTGVSGRVVELSVVGANGELLLKGLRVRWGLGVAESPFVIGRETAADGAVQRFVITGLGRGHGVGLCQLGATAMARSGATYEAILKHYYTGITLSGGSSSRTARSSRPSTTTPS